MLPAALAGVNHQVCDGSGGANPFRIVDSRLVRHTSGRRELYTHCSAASVQRDDEINDLINQREETSSSTLSQ